MLGRVDSREGKSFVEDLAKLIMEASGLFSILKMDKDIKTKWTKNYGYNLVFKNLWKNLGLGNVISNTFKNSSIEYDGSDALYNMVLNRLHDSSSKRALIRWQQKIYDINHYEEHQYYRTMGHLIAQKNGIEKDLFNHLRDSQKKSVDIVLFDTTTLVYYGEGDQKEELLARG